MISQPLGDPFEKLIRFCESNTFFGGTHLLHTIIVDELYNECVLYAWLLVSTEP